MKKIFVFSSLCLLGLVGAALFASWHPFSDRGPASTGWEMPKDIYHSAKY